MVSSSIDIFGLEQSNHNNFPFVVDVIKMSRFTWQLSTNIFTKEYVLQLQMKYWDNNEFTPISPIQNKPSKPK